MGMERDVVVNVAVDLDFGWRWMSWRAEESREGRGEEKGKGKYLLDISNDAFVLIRARSVLHH